MQFHSLSLYHNDLYRNNFVSKRLVSLWVSQLFLHFVTKLGEPFTGETKSWLGLKGDLPCWVTLFYGSFPPPSHPIVVGPTFLQMQTVSLTKVGQLGKGEETRVCPIAAAVCPSLWQKGSTFFSY